jgi:hypothetical protein
MGGTLIMKSVVFILLALLFIGVLMLSGCPLTDGGGDENWDMCEDVQECINDETLEWCCNVDECAYITESETFSCDSSYDGVDCTIATKEATAWCLEGEDEDPRSNAEVCGTFNCGDAKDNAGRLRECGECSFPWTCEENMCVQCTDERTDEEICGSQECGTIEDNCGDERTCGPCPGSDYCQGTICVSV